MLTDESLTFLKQLLDTPGSWGFESAPARLWRYRASTFSKVRGHVAGNSFAEVNPGPRRPPVSHGMMVAR